MLLLNCKDHGPLVRGLVFGWDSKCWKSSPLLQGINPMNLVHSWDGKESLFENFEFHDNWVSGSDVRVGFNDRIAKGGVISTDVLCLRFVKLCSIC